MFLIRGGTKGLALVKIIILARLLSPHDFGLFGIALIALNVLQTFTEIGAGEALIQKKEDINAYLDVAWTFKVLRGILLACLLFILAPFIAKFFNEPKAIFLLYIIGFSLIIGGLGNQGAVYFLKEQIRPSSDTVPAKTIGSPSAESTRIRGSN